MEDMLSMDDIRAVFNITDAFGIDRETIRIELTKEDPGSLALRDDANLEIVVPLSISIEAWLPSFRAELGELGYVESPEE